MFNNGHRVQWVAPEDTAVEKTVKLLSRFSKAKRRSVTVKERAGGNVGSEVASKEAVDKLHG